MAKIRNAAFGCNPAAAYSKATHAVLALVSDGISPYLIARAAIVYLRNSSGARKAAEVAYKLADECVE